MYGTEVPPEKGDSGIDLQAALAMAGGDMVLLRDLADAFLKEVPKLLHSLRMAVGQRDSEGLQTAAHQLQGVLRCLRIERALEQSQHLELLGKGTTDWPAAEELLAAVTATIHPAIDALKRFLSDRT